MRVKELSSKIRDIENAPILTLVLTPGSGIMSTMFTNGGEEREVGVRTGYKQAEDSRARGAWR